MGLLSLFRFELGQPCSIISSSCVSVPSPSHSPALRAISILHMEMAALTLPSATALGLPLYTKSQCELNPDHTVHQPQHNINPNHSFIMPSSPQHTIPQPLQPTIHQLLLPTTHQPLQPTMLQHHHIMLHLTYPSPMDKPLTIVKNVAWIMWRTPQKCVSLLWKRSVSRRMVGRVWNFIKMKNVTMWSELSA